MSVKFHLPGFRNNFPLNMLMLKMLDAFPKFFREGIEITSFFGEFPTCLWNGGRYSGGDQCDAGYVRQVIKTVNAAGVAIRYTFTNPTITEQDLSDPYCNFCMQAGDNGKNEVLVVSPILEEYIRKTYPGYTVNSSTCKEIRSIAALNDELSKDYGLVVLDYNLNNCFEELEHITDKARCEVLVNSCCIPNCPRRAEHYRFIAGQERTALANRALPENRQKQVPVWRCEYGEQNTLSKHKNYPTHISPDAIWNKYLPMGFKNFKIEGRTASLFSLVDTYCYYFTKPECHDEARLLLLTNLEANKIITVNKPRKGVWP